MPIYDPNLTIGDLADLFHKDSAYMDKTIFYKNNILPENPIGLIPARSKYSAGGRLMKYSRIIFAPLQYNPISKKLRLTGKANLTLSYQTLGEFEQIPFVIDRPANYVIVTTNKIKAGSLGMWFSNIL